MDDGAGRREARRFEPPPWEKEQFEELERRRAEDAALSRQPEADAEMPAAPAPVAPDPSAGDVERSQGAGQGAAADERGPSAVRPGLDDKAIEAMIFDLKAEEPNAGRPAWFLRVGVSVFLLVLGSVFVLWGMVGLVKVLRLASENRSAGLLVSGGLLTFGVVFVSLAGWAGYTAYQQRGVR